MENKNENPLSYQVGGDHYKKYEYQPIQLFADLDLGVIPANIVKYLARWRYKNGLEDLKKARHYALFWYELGIKAGENVEKFVAQFDEPEKGIMQNVLYGKTSEVVEALDRMIQICEDGQTHWEGENQEKRKAETPDADANLFEENETRKQ